MKKNCDKCGSKIIDGKCECGIWIETQDQPEHLVMFERAMVAYNRMNIDHPISGDHHTGTCIILFKGDYELCEDVKKYIESHVDHNVETYKILIQDIDFSIRTLNILNRYDVNTMERLISYSEDELLKWKAMGRKSLNEIKDKLNGLGFALKER